MKHTNPVLRNGGLHHFAIASVDFDGSLAFYIELLGCRPRMQWGEAPRRAVMLDVGDGNYVELFERVGSGGEPAEARLLHLCLRCDNLDEVVERLRGGGGGDHGGADGHDPPERGGGGGGGRDVAVGVF